MSFIDAQRSPRSKRRNALSRKILSTSSPDLRTMVLAVGFCDYDITERRMNMPIV